jgi:GAF domain-containing protein/HAMP domain-containing protein
MEEVRARLQGILYRVLKRTGGYYPILVIAIVQLISYPGALIGVTLSRLGDQLGADLFAKSAWFSAGMITLGHLVLLGSVYLFSTDALMRLEQIMRGAPAKRETNELSAWRQMTAMTWRYAYVAIPIALLIDIIPLLIYQNNVLGANGEQLIYTALAGAVSTVFNLTITILVIERLLQPAREILFPATFEAQIAGVVGMRVRQKFLALIMGTVFFSILLLAPVGYEKTYKILFTPVSSGMILNELRMQLIFSSAIVIAGGTLISFFLSNSVSSPLREIVGLFSRIEKGDLSLRAAVNATDEIGELAVYLNRMLSRLEELQQNLEKRVDDRTEQLRASNEVGRMASTILDPDVVITKVVNLITQSFDYYYAAIFLINSTGRWAELKDASGSTGAILKARRHRLQVGSKSLVGTAISTRDPQVALDVGTSAVRFNNPLLPNTRSEIAIPLMMGERVIGALDVQSVREADFKPDNIATLQNMANQVTIAIENARIFKEMDQAIEELRLVNREYVVSSWAEKLKANSLEYSTRSPSAGEPADTEIKEIEISLNLRDEKIGRIRLETSQEWDQDDQAWVEALATQVTVSLENARLVEESQQSALRERLSASIIQKLWASNSVDSILQTTVRELGRALETSEATIELNVEE